MGLVLFSGIFLFLQDLWIVTYIIDGQATFSLMDWESEIPLESTFFNPPAWSLGIELSFYILAPVLLRLRSANLLALFLALFLVKFAFMQMQSHNPLGVDPLFRLFSALGAFSEAMMEFGRDMGWREDLVYRLFPFSLPYFLLGALAFRFREMFNIFYSSRVTYPLAYTIVCLCLIVLFMVVPTGTFEYSVLFVFLAALIVPPLFLFTKDCKFDNFIGELSYPIYIFHVFFLMLAGDNWEFFNGLAIFFGIDHASLITVIAIIFVVSSPSCSLSWKESSSRLSEEAVENRRK